MNQLMQATIICIIGGADGPTAIYVGIEAHLQLFLPWCQEEITGYVFELDDSENGSEIESVETFYFTGDSSGNPSVMCTYGQKGKMLTCPIKLRQIDEKGILCIFDDSPQ